LGEDPDDVGVARPDGSLDLSRMWIE